MKGRKSSFLLRARRVDGEERLEITHLESARSHRPRSLSDAVDWIRERWSEWDAAPVSGDDAAATASLPWWRVVMDRLSRRTVLAGGGLAFVAIVALIFATGIVDLGDVSTAAGSNTRRLTACQPAPAFRIFGTPAPSTPCPTVAAAPTATATPTVKPTPTPTPTPTATPTPTPIAVPIPGAVWATGNNSKGALADGTETSSSSFISSGGFIATRISASTGWYDTIAQTSDGKVWGWGDNANGQLNGVLAFGQGVPPEIYKAPAELSNLAGSIQIVASRGDQFGLKPDGTVWDIWSGQLTGLTGIKAIAAGDDTFLALGSDGTVYDGSGKAIDGAGPAIAIATGAEHYLALKADGTVWAWGGNGDFGQCGVDPKLAIVVDKPTQVPNLSGVVALANSWRQSLALKSDGTVWGWGRNDNGQLGDGTATPAQYRYEAGPVVDLSGVVAISGGIAHSAAVKSDGTLWVWGSNLFGQLGVPDVQLQTTTPVQVKLPPSATAKVVAVAAGRQHTVILYGPK